MLAPAVTFPSLLTVRPTTVPLGTPVTRHYVARYWAELDHVPAYRLEYTLTVHRDARGVLHGEIDGKPAEMRDLYRVVLNVSTYGGEFELVAEEVAA